MENFTGYRALMNCNDGKQRVIWVCNTGQTSDGAPALKVQFGTLQGYTGWSGCARPQYQYDQKKIWVLASKVISK